MSKGKLIAAAIAAPVFLGLGLLMVVVHTASDAFDKIKLDFD